MTLTLFFPFFKKKKIILTKDQLIFDGNQQILLEKHITKIVITDKQNNYPESSNKTLYIYSNPKAVEYASIKELRKRLHSAFLTFISHDELSNHHEELKERLFTPICTQLIEKLQKQKLVVIKKAISVR